MAQNDEFAFGPDTPGPLRPWRPVVSSLEATVVAGHPLAAQAAAEILQEGGNAVDAGVAAGIMLAVVESPLVGFSGVAPSLYFNASSQSVEVSSGVGTWPKAASSAFFRDNFGGAIPKGIYRTVVPAAPHVWIRWLEKYGTISFSRAAAAAIKIARNGFALNPYLTHIINTSRGVMADWPSSIRTFYPHGRDAESGEIFRQPDLAASIQYMCDEERAKGRSRADGLRSAHDAFYQGDIARAICEFYEKEGGFLRRSDMAEIDVPIEQAISTSFHGHTIFSGRAWGQGPSFLEALRILEPIDLTGLGHNSADYIHLLIETVKLVAADRERYFGDPNFVFDVTEELLSTPYIAERRAIIDRRNALAFPQLSRPIGDVGSFPEAEEGESEQRATTFLAVVDRNGNVFSATPSDGSRHGPIVPGTGLAPSGRGATSKATEGHPAEVTGGKRPRMMTGPLFARLRDGRSLAFGSPGSDTQLQANLQFLFNILCFGMDLQTAVEAARFSSFGFPGSFAPQRIKPLVVKVEADIPTSIRDELIEKGHSVEAWVSRPWMAGSVGAVVNEASTGLKLGAADPRRNAYAIGLI